MPFERRVAHSHRGGEDGETRHPSFVPATPGNPFP
jgi:hypothetical protein